MTDKKQTDGGKLFHTLTTCSTKKLLRTLLVQRDLNNLYACPLVFVVNLNSFIFTVTKPNTIL